MTRQSLIPELYVTDCAASLAFWCGVCGFSVAYDRPEEGFAMIEIEGNRVMLDQIGEGRDWMTGPMERPFGRGINLQIMLSDIGPVLAALEKAGWPLHLPLEEKRYRVGAGGVTQRQFLVQDPDGYLIRFAQETGRD
jgi:catechol 2,3-dioxygenase-like lactoylglutathione lyase family enzyme